MKNRWLPGLALSLLSIIAVASTASGQAAHVRWDIVSVNFPTTTVSPGGVAFAAADASLKIKLTGAGTFVAPASSGTSSAVTGGGTWETFTGNTSTASGTFTVTGLASWQFANFQTRGWSI